MRHLPLLAAALLLAAAGPAQEKSPQEKPLQDTEAFERGFAISLYQFDACGDPLAGRMFRRALTDRFDHCPFSPEARNRYRDRTRAELARVRERMQRMVEENGGLPRELAGMSTTCHAQQASAPYREFRALLERYAGGAVPAEAVIPAPCDAADIMP
jgi:hypothetical protein